ncbi:hypothetical protein C8J56DRAFT_1056203 [Mycena floridula]|nr:hypothetical protein C8J56DRAFT_1056203 [Mycena floridula]
MDLFLRLRFIPATSLVQGLRVSPPVSRAQPTPKKRLRPADDLPFPDLTHDRSFHDTPYIFHYLFLAFSVLFRFIWDCSLIVNTSIHLHCRCPHLIPRPILLVAIPNPSRRFPSSSSLAIALL